MIKEIIVVEGKDDTAAIRRAIDAETIETGGSAIDRRVIERIRLAQERRGVIVLTDPDHAGERIRKIISAHVPGCKHAFLLREEAVCKGDIGVENARPETIRKALEQVKTETRESEAEISREDLIDAGLIHHPAAASRREQLGDILRIGRCNGKQLYNRLRMYRISREEFGSALSQLKE